jgi:urease accessory protein
VAGDDIAVEVDVGAGAAALLTTQAETKVYRAQGGRGAAQRMGARVGRGGTLALVPDPVSPFSGSRYEQQLRFELETGASLLALDAVTAGRSARGERWALERYRASTEVFLDGRRLCGDALLLTNPLPRLSPSSVLPTLPPLPPTTGPERGRNESLSRPGAPARALSSRLGRFDALATVIALGPAFATGAIALLARIAAQPVEPGADVITAASPVADGVFLRCAATSAETLAAFLSEALRFAAVPLGEDPFARKW